MVRPVNSQSKERPNIVAFRPERMSNGSPQVDPLRQFIIDHSRIFVTRACAASRTEHGSIETRGPDLRRFKSGDPGPPTLKLWRASCFARKAALVLRSSESEAGWRRGGDSNPRCPCEHAAFRVRCIRPLCHLSAVMVGRCRRGALDNGCTGRLQGPICLLSGFFGTAPFLPGANVRRHAV